MSFRYLPSFSLISTVNSGFVIVISAICFWFLWNRQKAKFNNENLNCTGLNYSINLTKWINVTEIDQGNTMMYLIESNRTTLFMFTVKSRTAQREWILFKDFYELKAFYKNLCIIMAEPPPFPAAYNSWFSAVKQANRLKDWLQEVLDLAKLLEPVRVALEKEFELNDISRHVRNGDCLMLEYLLKQKSANSPESDWPKKQTHSQADTRDSAHLHMAAAWGNEKCVKLLLDHGIRADTLDNYSLTPIDIAQKRGHDSVVRLLREYLEKKGQISAPKSGSEAIEDSWDLPTIYTTHPYERRFLVFVNPFSGTGNGIALWEHLMRPIFDELNISYEVVRTTHRGHVLEYVASLDCSNYDTFLIVSGDGLLFELLNGLKRNKNGIAIFRRMQIAIVPAGSGNAVCGSLGIQSVLEGTTQMVKGKIKGCDLCKVKQPGVEDHLSIVEVTWGLISSVDFDSEKYLRWMGEPRFTVQGVLEVLKKTQYQARVIARKEIPTAEEEENEREYLRKAPDWWQTENPNPPPGWIDYGTTCCNIVHCGVTPCVSKNSRVCAKIGCGDGFMQLILARECTRMQLFSILLALDDGSLINKPSVTWQKTTSCVLLPCSEECLVDVDGERFKNLRTHMEVINNYVTMCC